ncbi:MAG: hypothetical protein Q8R55_04490 [Candidatus Taylorbacteria bacterium]|nr:hypothetical protein [Candidatus Taylorbacteria bacterium]
MPIDDNPIPHRRKPNPPITITIIANKSFGLIEPVSFIARTSSFAVVLFKYLYLSFVFWYFSVATFLYPPLFTVPMLLGKHVLDEKEVHSLIADIKQKKELRELSDDFVHDRLFKYLQKNHKAATFLLQAHSPKSSRYKSIIKAVRAELRTVTGLFQLENGPAERQKLLAQLLKGAPLLPTVAKIVQTHASTKERLPFYRELYLKIFAQTGIPQTIIDFGCGLNPFSIPYMAVGNLKYYAYDIAEGEIASLKQFFRWLHRQNPAFVGSAEVLDLLHWVKLKELVKADICFLFKMTDVLDRGKGYKVTEAVIKGVPAQWVVVSFPTLTMSGKKMNNPRRIWIELMCQRLFYKFYILGFNNEMFYVIRKSR